MRPPTVCARPRQCCWGRACRGIGVGCRCAPDRRLDHRAHTLFRHAPTTCDVRGMLRRPAGRWSTFDALDPDWLLSRSIANRPFLDALQGPPCVASVCMLDCAIRSIRYIELEIRRAGSYEGSGRAISSWCARPVHAILRESGKSHSSPSAVTNRRRSSTGRRRLGVYLINNAVSH